MSKQLAAYTKINFVTKRIILLFWDTCRHIITCRAAGVLNSVQKPQFFVFYLLVFKNVCNSVASELFDEFAEKIESLYGES